MELPPLVRVFFAIDLTQSNKEKLGEFINVLKKQARTHGIRWTKPDNLHITLQFLPQVQSEHLSSLIDEVSSEIEGTMKMNVPLHFGKLHLFPNPYRPRVIVLDIIPQDDLLELSKLIGEGILCAGYEIESRPFRAHLTLGRIKQPQDVDLGFMSQVHVPAFDEIEVKQVTLFRSEPEDHGSRYTVLERIKF